MRESSAVNLSQSHVCLDGQSAWCGESGDASDATFTRDAFLRALSKASFVLNNPHRTEGSVNSASLNGYPVVKELIDIDKELIDIDADQPEFTVGVSIYWLDDDK